MDILSKLPLELSQQIFSYLQVDDLGRCLRVSKQWRSIANDDIFWKYHSLKYGISDEECEADFSSDLCHWGLVWNAFSKTLAYKWHSNSYRTIELSKNDYEGFASHGDRIAVFSKMFNNVDVYTVKKNTNRARLLVSLFLCFPKEGPALIAMDSNYIAVAKYNSVLIFRKVENTYELISAYAIVFRNVLFATRDFASFVNNHINRGASVEIDAFSNNIMWLSDFEGSFVIDIDTNHTTHVFTYESARVQGNLFVTWSDDSVLLYNIEGSNEAILDNIDGLEDVGANATLLSLLRGYSNDFCLVEVYDLESSDQVLSKEMPVYTWIKLHPKEEILYTLEASCNENIFRITAWRVRSGIQEWTFQSSNNCFVSFWELHVVCEKYLVIWPTASGGKKFYLIDSKSGKCIYEESRPSGLVNFISDFLWISWPEDRSLAIRSYV